MLSLGARRRYVLVVSFASLVLAMCRDYGAGPNGGRSQGGMAGDSGHSPGGATGVGGAIGGISATGGDSGRQSSGAAGAKAGEAGAAGTAWDGAGQAGGGGLAGGAAGEGGDDNPEPGIYGAVRLMVDGIPTCGGTLITNSWVLTAESCVPQSLSSLPITVGFGMDSRHFEQVRQVVELQRYPGSGGMTAVPDLMLVGVGAPFALEGSTFGHHVELWFEGGGRLYGQHHCVGWDLVPDPASATDRLHAETLTSVAVPPGGVEQVWWLNSNLFDPAHGALLTSNDVGSGCFKHIDDTALLTTVHAGTPLLRHDGTPNDNQEAYSTSVAQPGVQAWVNDTLLDVDPETDWLAWGDAAVCSSSPGTLDLFSLDEDGRMAWRRQNAWPSSPADAPWAELPIIEPPETELAPDRPGVLCSPDGTLELFARGVDDTVWWQRWRSGAWAPEWELVPDASATSGLSVVGVSPQHFHVFHRGALHELRHGEYDGAMHWRDLGGVLDGAPVARFAHPEWWEVYVRQDGALADYFRWFGDEGWVEPRDSIASDPAVVGWTEHVHVFSRDSNDGLRWFWLTSLGYPPLVDTSVRLPPGHLTAVTRAPGRFDIFVSELGHPVWHAWWPRDPQPDDGS